MGFDCDAGWCDQHNLFPLSSSRKKGRIAVSGGSPRSSRRTGLQFALYGSRLTTGTPTWREAAWTSAVDARASRLVASGYHPDAAYLPEARGRSERAFRTLQDRLPKELALAGISDMRFAIPAAETGTAFIPWIGSPLAEILCVQEERVVAIDNPVRVSGPELADPAGSPPALVI